VFAPVEPYERISDVGDVVFPCGYTHDAATKEIKLYYGAADTSIALATGNSDELLDWMKHNS